MLTCQRRLIATHSAAYLQRATDGGGGGRAGLGDGQQEKDAGQERADEIRDDGWRIAPWSVDPLAFELLLQLAAAGVGVKLAKAPSRLSQPDPRAPTQYLGPLPK